MKLFSLLANSTLALIALAVAVPTDACTGIKLKAKDGGMVEGRTLEFGIPVDCSVAVIPRGYQFTGATPEGPGLSYKAKYGAVGVMAFNNPALMDGMNEKGLNVGTFYFPGFASYPAIDAENQKKAVSPVEFGNWLLVNFASVDEVKAALSDIVIAPTVNKEWGNTPPPFHYAVFDKSGNGIVIEPIDGKLVVYDNPLGVLTNSPTFEWHMTNLRNYINLTPFNVKPLKVDGLELAPFGQGSGMVGMPGDFTPPSRFVRAAIFSITATPVANAEEAIFQGFHILHQFDIPVGVSQQKDGGTAHSDYTQFTAMRDPQSLKYYFNTYADQTIQMVDLKKFDLDAKAIKMFNPSKESQRAVDISANLK